MTCPNCKTTMTARRVRVDDEFRGKSLSITTEGFVCPTCGFEAIKMDQMGEYGRSVADAYRMTEGLLTSGEIRSARERLGMSQGDFADYLGVGVASVKRWEWGQVQDRSSDMLIRLKTDLREAERNAQQLRARREQWAGWSGTEVEQAITPMVMWFARSERRRSPSWEELHLRSNALVSRIMWTTDKPSRLSDEPAPRMPATPTPAETPVA